MSAYNKLAGTSSAVSPLLKSLVIGEWGFDGTLCTDAWGPQMLVNDQMAYANLPAAMAAIIKGGTGLILQDQADARPAVMTAYSGGMITAADIDAASRANLRVRFRLGDFDPRVARAVQEHRRARRRRGPARRTRRARSTSRARRSCC